MVTGTLVIDPGHGGLVDAGGSSHNNAVSFSGVLEKSMTLQMATLVRDALEASNTGGQTAIQVFLTRDSDINLGLTDRARVAGNHRADLFLSIHFNGFDGRARGVETLIRPAADGNVNHDDDAAFARRIQRAVVEAIRSHDAAVVDRGIKDQKLGVLRDAALGNTAENHPCRACLVEIEFIDVPAVDELLNTGSDSAAVRAHIAAAIRDAIIEELS
jgi:N-acetylmuramoyl-L-alanine amidase